MILTGNLWPWNTSAPVITIKETPVSSLATSSLAPPSGNPTLPAATGPTSTTRFQFRSTAGKMWLRIALLSTLILWAAAGDPSCGKCDASACVPPAENCLAGLVRDLCGCCYVCGRREGERCDGDSLPPQYRGREGAGPCGEHLECRPRTDQAYGDPPEAQCVCVKNESMCGSDGRTYPNECQVTEARYRERNGLQVVHMGPCRSAPKIVTPPEDVSNSTGGHVAMSCEAMGFPTPAIEWRVDRGKGDTIPLPSDDPKIAVQSRGGPSKYEITSWLQILNIQAEDDATYWCIAKNEEGESSAAAKIILLESKNDL